MFYASPRKGLDYCTASFAVMGAEKNNERANLDDLSRVKKWFSEIRLFTRNNGKWGTKRELFGKKGPSQNSLVLLAPHNDFARMIEIYFALKVWVLTNKFQLRED